MIQFAQYRSLPHGYSLYVTGDCDILGLWTPSSSIRMTYQEKDTWIANVSFQVNQFKYKYFTAKTEDPEADIKWDEGENRRLNLTKVEQFDSLNIMTFNIRYDCGEEGFRNWNKRKHLVCQTIQQVNPDILGCQAVLIHQKQYLEEQLENYNIIWRGREANFWEGEGNPIIYNVLKFDLLFAEVFWLSDTPQVAGSKTYGNFIPRICTYARLQHKKNNVIINVFCTHFDHENSVSQVKSALQIKDRINDNLEKVIVIGDLNCLPLSEPVKILEKHQAYLQNTMSVLDIPLATFHNWYGLKLGLHIDYIFVRNITWKKTKILNQQINGCYASDHFAKVAECEYQHKY